MPRTPPLATIEAFVAAMRRRTFRAAADDLALSPSAFSRRICTLEAHLGLELFARGGRPTPTHAAHTFLLEVGPLLDALKGAARVVGAKTPKPALRILVAPSLAAEWLMSKLAEALPSIGVDGVNLDVGAPGCELDPMHHDLAIVAARSSEGGRPSDVLAPVEAAVVSATMLADRRRPPATLNEVGAFDRLDMRFPDGMWRRWSERSGAPMPRDRGHAPFASIASMYEAAAAGFGIALAVPIVSERRLREGVLRPCFRGLTPLGFDFRIVYRDSRTRARCDVQQITSPLRDAANDTWDRFRKQLG